MNKRDKELEAAEVEGFKKGSIFVISAAALITAGMMINVIFHWIKTLL